MHEQLGAVEMPSARLSTSISMHGMAFAFSIDMRIEVDFITFFEQQFLRTSTREWNSEV